VAAQLQSAVVFGLSAALYGSTFREGRVQQSNFHDYRPLRLFEMPVVEVHIVPSTSAGEVEAGRPADRPRWRTPCSRPPARGCGGCR
jgi:isoquinoline 1-oxidoreductase beta subunit